MDMEVVPDAERNVCRVPCNRKYDDTSCTFNWTSPGMRVRAGKIPTQVKWGKVGSVLVVLGMNGIAKSRKVDY
jgi:hypothetical protein